jgi:N-acetyl sugar amidotransferase
MDTSDPEIIFDESGVCNYCRDFTAAYPSYQPDSAVADERLLLPALEEIKARGKDKEYDCIVGLSGGVDSSYVAYLAKIHGLRPLCVHFDSGWNSELAVKNIENIVNTLGFDLHTYVCDWRDMKDLQLSFFKAGVANCDIPQDHAFTAGLYETADKYDIRYLINGHNVATEFVMPMEWGYTSHDLTHIKSIQRKFGSRKIRNLPTYSAYRKFIRYKYLKPIRVLNILNYIPYVKTEVKKFLQSNLGWRDYGGKHYESRFTRFFQAYYLPTKFGFDKRKAHLSSLVITGQMTREQAQEELNAALYGKQELREDMDYIARKLGITLDEFKAILSQPNKHYTDYGYSRIIDFARRAKHKGVPYAAGHLFQRPG